MTFSRMPRKGNPCEKLISIFLILSFVSSNIVFAAPSDGPSKVQNQQLVLTDPNNIVIPREFGLVKTKFTGTGKESKLIIHIQDAHCNYEAQSNIVKILENLYKNYNVNLVSVEGADGVIDTSWFKAFPDNEVRKEVADYFMKKGEITGPEFLSITSDYNIKLFGAETRSYYIDNLNAFTASYPLKEETEKYLNGLKRALNKLKGFIYSEDLKLMDAKAADYESKKLAFNDYVKFLQSEAERAKINLRSYDNLFKLVNVLVYEKKIDFNVTDKERSELIDELSKLIPKETLTELVNKSLEFKAGKITSADYYSYLKSLAVKNEIDMAKTYPNLYNYIIYNSVYSKIENEKLFSDIKKVEIDIKEKLFTNDDQRTLEKLSRHIEILIGLVNIKLLNDDFEYFEKNKAEFAHGIFADFIRKKTAQYALAYELDDPNDAVAKSLPKLEDFYSIAIKRDKALVDNTLGQMKKDKTDIAVLVTGGFHSEGMSKLLEAQGVSYMVVCPSITKDVPTPYIQILTNQRTPLEDILVRPALAGENQASQAAIDTLAPPLITECMIFNSKAFEDFPDGYDLEIRVSNFESDFINVYIFGTVKLGRVTQTQIGAVTHPIKGHIERARDTLGANVLDIVTSLRAQIAKNYNPRDMKKQARLLAGIDAQIKDHGTLQKRIEDELDRRAARKGAVAGRTPGTGATGRVLETDQEVALFDGIIETSYKLDRARNADLRQGVQFVKHDGMMEALEARGLPVNVHPGRGGKVPNLGINHDRLQAHIDSYIYDKLAERDASNESGKSNRLDRLAAHERMHLDIFNIEHMSEEARASKSKEAEWANAFKDWELWRSAGKPEGDSLEVFINGFAQTDTRDIAYEIDHIAAEKRVLNNRASQQVMDNIDLSRASVDTNANPPIVAVISGTKVDADYWGVRFNSTTRKLFRKDGETRVFSLQEKIGAKEREGNFLGTLLAYRTIKDNIGGSWGHFSENFVTFVGMLFGRGERMSPFTQIKGDRKPAIAASAANMDIGGKKDSMTAIEEAMHFFAPVAAYMQERGWRGALDKWGDETQVPSIKLSEAKNKPSLMQPGNEHDMVKLTSVIEITDATAEEKDWVVFDEKGNFVAQLSRNKKDILIGQLKELGIKPDADGKYHAGVSLGPIGVSYDVLDIMEYIFKKDVDTDGIYMDFDPYLLMLFAMRGDEEKWLAAKKTLVDKSDFQGLMKMIPDLWEKVNEVRRIFAERYSRELNLKVLDLGSDIYWADIGQHSAMREKYMAINDEGPRGVISRKIEGIESYKRDANGNIIVNSTISPGVKIKNSVIINSTITGSGVINGSVIKDSILHYVDIDHAFVVSSVRTDVTLQPNSGLYESIGTKAIVLGEKMREGTLLLSAAQGGAVSMKVEEDTKLRDKKATYDVPILGNVISFSDAYDMMLGVSVDELNARRDKEVAKVLERIKLIEEREEAKIAKIGTSGIRGNAKEILTDKEIYINFLAQFLYARELTENNDLPKGPLTDFIRSGAIQAGQAAALAGDLRPSTPRIMIATAAAALAAGLPSVDFQGLTSTPALANYGINGPGTASVMITASHNPYPENGGKTYWIIGELLKPEEPVLKPYVDRVRRSEYIKSAEDSIFDENGAFKDLSLLSPSARRMVEKARDMVLENPSLPAHLSNVKNVRSTRTINGRTMELSNAEELYYRRFADTFTGQPLKGKTIVWWMQSAVGSYVCPLILEALGATVIRAESSDEFVPIDTENLSEESKKTLAGLAEKYKADFVITADGDSDRPVTSDEKGNHVYGDKLGVLTSLYLGLDFAAIPISANSHAVQLLKDRGVKVVQTKVGSPYVIETMFYEGQKINGKKTRGGFEINGGFILGTDITLPNGKTLKALPTRDSMLPMIAAMLYAIQENKTMSQLVDSTFSGKYSAFTPAGLVENVSEKQRTPGCENYSPAMGPAIIESFSPADSDIIELEFTGEGVYSLSKGKEEAVRAGNGLTEDAAGIKDRLSSYLQKLPGLNDANIEKINFLDGIRVYFRNLENQIEIVHLRPSGNAAQFRMYTEAEKETRANELLGAGIAPNTGILVQIIQGYRKPEVSGKPKLTILTPGIYGGNATPSAAISSTSLRPAQSLDIFANLDTESPSAAVSKANTLLQIFAQPNIDTAIKNQIKSYYYELAGLALQVESAEQSRGLQMIACQTLAIITMIEQGVSGADKIELTAVAADMLPAFQHKTAGPQASYIDAKSVAGAFGTKDNPSGIAKTEGAEGLWWRGWEGISKLGANGENIIQLANYADNQAELGRLIMYGMLHLGKFHTTVFTNNKLPKSIQYISTGRGHFQGNMLDIKYVVSGQMLQMMDFYDDKGNRTDTLAILVKEGEWAVAIPGAVDYVIPLTETVIFNDVSVPAPEESIPGITETPAKLAAIEAAVNKNTQAGYGVIKYQGASALVKIDQGAVPIEWLVRPIPDPLKISGVKKFGINTFFELSRNEEALNVAAEDISMGFDWSPEKPAGAPAIITAADVEHAAEAVKVAESGMPIISRPTDAPVLKRYAWGGTGLSNLLGFAKDKIAEIWFNSTQGDGLSPVSGKDITLADAIAANPEKMLGKGMTAKPIFNKILGKDENQPQIVHVGFNEKIVGNEERFKALMIQERGYVRELMRILARCSLTKEQFDQYAAAYEKWVSREIASKWTTKEAPELPSFLAGFPSVIFENIRSTREELVSYLNEIKLNSGQVIISPVGYVHSIVGSHQTHPLDVEAKNEAWYIISSGVADGLLYFEPQQTSNTTYGPFDFPTPIVWKASDGAKPANVGMRKDFLNDKKELANLRLLLKPGEDMPIDEEGVIRLVADRTMRFEPTKPEDFIVNSSVIDITAEYSEPVRAKAESLISGSYSVMENPPFTLERITLSGEGASKPASISDNPVKDSFHELTVVKGKVTVTISGKKEVLAAGSTVFVPAFNTNPIAIKADGEAEVLKTYPPAAQVANGEQFVTVTHRAAAALKLAQSEQNTFTMWVPQRMYNGDTLRDEKGIMADITGGRVTLRSYSSISDVTVEHPDRDVIIATDKDIQNIKNTPDITDAVKSARMLPVSQTYIDYLKDNGRIGGYAREIEVIGVVLGNTERKDIDEKTPRGINLYNMLRGRTKTAITNISDIAALLDIDPNKGPGAIAERLAGLLKLPIIVPFDSNDIDRAIQGRRQALWSA